jgi:thioester reductase-like protein
VLETDFPSIDGLEVANGYSQSKWVSESMIRKARERGVPGIFVFISLNCPVLVFRPADIVGDSSSGALNTQHDIVRFIRAVTRMGSAPLLNKQVVIFSNTFTV